MTAPDDNTGFDKKATLDDSDEEGMVKRGIIEDPNDVGNAADGFAQLPKRPEQ